MLLRAPFPRRSIASSHSPPPIAAVTIPLQIPVFATHPTASPTHRASPSRLRIRTATPLQSPRPILTVSATAVPNQPPLDLTEDNVRDALADARVELAQIFDDSVGITGVVELAELDGPFVKIRLRGRFWHKRSTVVARVGNYLKQRIPEILEVEIEDEEQLDDSPASF